MIRIKQALAVFVAIGMVGTGAAVTAPAATAAPVAAVKFVANAKRAGQPVDRKEPLQGRVHLCRRTQ